MDKKTKRTILFIITLILYLGIALYKFFNNGVIDSYWIFLCFIICIVYIVDKYFQR